MELLGQVAQGRLAEAARDDGYLAAVRRVAAAFRSDLAGGGWYGEAHADEAATADGPPLHVAYFSAEFGLHESLPIYSGGLGVLAGDHLKSASDLGVPLTAVGLLYRNGYFQQSLSPDGRQLETYPELDFYNLAIDPVKGTRRPAPAGAGGAARRPGRRGRVAGTRRPGAAAAARHEPARERPGRPRDHRPAVRRRDRDADPPGDRAGHRRHPRAGGPERARRPSST